MSSTDWSRLMNSSSRFSENEKKITEVSKDVYRVCAPAHTVDFSDVLFLSD
jgi:hypothetical protein